MARVPRVVVHNWRLKLSALGLSIFLWALVQTEPLSQETFSAVPIRVEISDTAWTLARAPSSETVQLRLGGPAREIIRLAREGTSLHVPIDVIGSRDTVVVLQRDWVRLGQSVGVTVESVSPATLALSFEPAVTRSLPLSMATRGQLPSHLALASELALDPAVVQVRGPESRIAGLDSVSLTPFDLSRVRDSDIVTLPVDTTGLAGASVLPPEATVGIRVEPLLERIIDNVPVQAGSTGDGAVTVEPSSVRLHVSGARTLVTAMNLGLLRVSVAPEALDGLMPGEERLVRLRVEGLPPLVSGRPGVDVVAVRLTETAEELGGRDAP